MRQILVTALPEIPLIEAGADLAALAWAALQKTGLGLVNDDVVVFTSKIVSKAEGRLVDLRQVRVSATAYEIAQVCAKDPRLVELILAESQEVLRLRAGLIVVEHRLGFICANAGIDHSNLGRDDDWALLLPADPDASANRLRAQLMAASGGADIAVLINDSHGRAWRLGTVGVAIGVAGMKPLSDLRGSPDLFGRILQATELGIADELAATASLLQGASTESSPIIHLRGASYRPGSGQLAEILRPRSQDMFR